MKLLVVGGTRFVGWHLASAALARGHEVTLFNRGRAGAGPGGARLLVGDRKADLSVLQGERWDAVLDTCAYLPRDVTRMAAALQASVGHYLLVSTVSVYASFATPNDEQSALRTIDNPDTEVVDGATYGPLKALCERAVIDQFGAARSTLVRPGLIVGPRDPTQRFTYWPARAARAGDGAAVLLPGRPADALQFIDARDLAEFMLGLVEAGTPGCFNATSPPGQITMGSLWEACCDAAGQRPNAVWADAGAVERLGLKPWSDLPVWLPAQGDSAAFAHTEVGAALGAGLRIRALGETVADTLAWWHSLPADQQAFTHAGLTAEREAAARIALGALR